MDDDDEADEDLIEEITMEEEMPEDDGISNSAIIRIVDNNGTEFICPDGAHEIDDGDDNDVQEVHELHEMHQHHFQTVVSEDQGGNVLHYSLVDEEGNPTTLMDRDMLKASNALLDNNNGDIQILTDEYGTTAAAMHQQAQSQAQTQQHQHQPQNQQVQHNANKSRKTKKPAGSAAPHKLRTVAATASSIAAAASDDNYEVDDRLIAEFINQHSSPLSNGKYVCNLCRQEFKQYKGLQNHMHSHTNWIRANCKKQPQCEICLKTFKGPGMLKMHMKTHLAESRTPTCSTCNKSFKSKAILYRHRQTHQLRPYACGAENCRKNFSSHSTLKAHAEQKHPQIQMKYKCAGCCDFFMEIEDLEQHIQLTGHCGGGGGGNNQANNTTANTVNSLGQNNVQMRTVNVGNMGGGLMGAGDVIVVTQA